MINKNHGITLISLIVTMVVLLIIASISLAVVLGDGGLISRARNAKANEEYNDVYEEVNNMILEMQNESEFPITLEEIKTQFSGNYVKDEEGIEDLNRITFRYKDHDFEIDNTLRISKIDKIDYINNPGGQGGYINMIDPSASPQETLNPGITGAPPTKTPNNTNTNTTNTTNTINTPNPYPEYEDIAESAIPDSLYAVDNIELLYDGIYNTRDGHSNSSKYWYDLSAKKLNMNKKTGTSNWSSKALVLDGSTYYEFGNLPNRALGTLEVCFEMAEDCFYLDNSNWRDDTCIIGNKSMYGIVINSSGNIAIGYDDKMYNTGVAANDGKVHTVTYIYTDSKIACYVDGLFKTEIAHTSSGNTSMQFGLGWNNQVPATVFKGSIYSVRLYKGELAEESITRNYIIDNLRFQSENITVADYIDRNLLMHLDGQNRTNGVDNASDDTWYDSKENHNATVIAGQVDWDNNKAYFDGSTKMEFDTPTGNSYGMVEVCFSIDEDMILNGYNWAEGNCLVGGGVDDTSQGWTIFVRNNGQICIGYAGYAEQTGINVCDGGIYTVDVVYKIDYAEIYVNGNFILRREYYRYLNSYPNQIEKFSLGWNGTNEKSKITGNIYDVRFYDKYLTPTEIKHNYKMDQKKYASNEASNPDQYFKKDLKMLLDGKNHTGGVSNASNDIWYDLSGNNNNATKVAGTATWESDGLYLDGNTLFKADSPTGSSDNVTVEICVTLPNDGSFVPIENYYWSNRSSLIGNHTGGYNRHWGIGVLKNGNTVLGYRNSETNTIEGGNIMDGKPHTVTYCYKNDVFYVWIDGVYKKRIGSYSIDGTGWSEFGIGYCMPNASTAIKGKIHSVRFYEGKLRAEAIRQNAARDMELYGTE